MDLSLAKRIWGKDNAYVKINNYFCKYGTYSKITNSKRKDLYVDFNDEKFFIPLIIKTLIENSDTVKSPLVYYRGDSSFAKQTFKREGFTSVAKDITQAATFADSSDTSLFRVKVDPGVKRIAIGIESEVLLEPGCLWEFQETEKSRSVENKKVIVYDVRVRRPENVPKGVPTFGACIIAKRKSKKWRKQAKKSKMKRHYANFKIEYEELGLSPSKNDFKEYLTTLNETYNSNSLSNLISK
tara:strand:+ start:616 stop:1338 length:723 start_codon:yes stop_codon:yes gene_type:complete